MVKCRQSFAYLLPSSGSGAGFAGLPDRIGRYTKVNDRLNRTRKQEEKHVSVLKAEKLADKIYLMEVEAPRVARSCEAGGVCDCQDR